MLSAVFVALGHAPVERQPVIGRTGPDLTLNAVGLVVDVKSRLEVPKTYIGGCPRLHGELIVFPLKLLGLPIEPLPCYHRSLLVERYWEHMDAWRRQKMPAGVTAVVLHRPALRFSAAQLVIHVDQFNLFEEKLYAFQPDRRQAVAEQHPLDGLQ
jgi:hypothetical protein